MVETELLQPVGVHLVEQQRSEQPGSVDICGLQNPLNAQQEAVESIAVRQQTPESVDFYSSQNMVDVKTPFWQRKVGELCPDDFCSLQGMLDAQRDKIHQQLQELQKVVVLQCRITGTNPLAQEMAAAVLDKRIGKRFGESLTPKALKCLYNVFSIKDTITKKEAREISALCGATVTQVREFFAGQRSRVRKVVQSSHVDQGSDDMFLKLQSIELDQSTIVLHRGEDILSLSSQQVESRQCNHLLLLDGFRGREDGMSSKLHAVEKAEHLINVMHKESTFTGQGQLAHVIMQAHESVLRCFMARGGLQQINKWLIQAAAEEQTSLIRVMLKAITQLPLGSALPRHMSLLLQTVNKLRFYRAQDIASRARLLLSRWSRFFKSSQGGKMVSFAGLARTTQPGQKRNRDSTHPRTIDDASKKKSKVDIMVDSGQSSDLVSSSLTEDKTMQERDKPEAVTEINITKKRLGSFLIQGDRAKEKRKVQLFEETRAAIRRKDGDSTRSSSFESSSRPLSADDIKKAKRRAYFLNSAKSQKPSSSRSDGSITLDLLSSSAEEGQRKTVKSAGSCGGVHESLSGENCLDCTLASVEGRHLETASKLRINPKVSDVLAAQHADLPMSMNGKGLNVVNKSVQNAEVHRLAELLGTPGLDSNRFELSLGVKQSELCEGKDAMDMLRIPWTTPPRIALDPRWKNASGEHSTEIVSESKRLRNEVEAIYLSPQCIPPNPEEPAERLCLFVDDALVPEILLEALDEESQEKDCSLQSPRDLESAKVRGEEADSQKSITNIDCKPLDEVLCSSRKGIDTSVALDMSFGDTHKLELITMKDQQSSLLSETTELNFNKPVKKVNSATDPTKNFYVDPSEFTLATPVEQACMEPRESKYSNVEAYQEGRDTSCLQLQNRDPVPACREQNLFESSTVCEASAAEPLPNTAWKKDITSSLQNDCIKASGSFAANMEVPLLRDQSANSNNSSGVDLSELSKEDCMDMLNIVLQQLTDNAKGSGADLELLSVFLKNPQLVYSLTSSHVGPSSKGISSASTGRHLSEMMAGSTIEDLNNQIEKLVGRTNSANLLEKARPHTSQFMQPVRPPIAVAGPQSHLPLPPSMPRSLTVVDPQIQLPNKECKVFGGTQFLKHPLSKADISLNSTDYDWSQPYDYPANCMQQGAGLARHSMHTSKTIDNCPSISTYSKTPPGYTQSHLTRASPSQNPSALLTQTDQRVHSSMLMYDGGHVHMNASTLHAERNGRVGSRRNEFPVVDAPHARLLQTGAGISDGILPVPDISSNNLRVHPSKVMHETHPLHGGKVPAFVPEVRGTPAVVGNQMPPYLSNGHHYNDPNFRPQSAPSSRPPYVPHGQLPPSFLMNSMRPQVNSLQWRPPPSRSNHSRHFRPGWRED